ncbi:hypothetical protein IWZ01DRAFT_484459 [Phyllosticta capitalensis]
MSTNLANFFQTVSILHHHLKTLDVDTENDMSAASSSQQNTMQDTPTPQDHGRSFLDLPLSIRQKIYEYALVKGCIHIEPVRCDIDQPWKRWKNLFPLRSSERRVQRRTTRRDVRKRPRITYEHEAATCGGLPLGLLESCRQIYQESAPIFYSRNSFCFDCDEDQLSIPIALCFLQDRSAFAVEWIRCIKIRVGTKNWLSFDLFGEDEDGKQLRADTLSFVDCVKKRLSGLKHLSIDFRGWPPDLRRENNEDEIQCETARASTVGILLLLPKVEYLSLQICAYRDSWRDEVPDDPAIPLAFAALVRSCLLKGGENLGASNITVHNRHWLTYAHPPAHPEAVVYSRDPRSLYVVRSSDKEGGESLLRPAEHPSPTWTVERPPQLEGYSRLCWGWPYGLILGNTQNIDDDCADGGDEDSLLEFDFEGENLETVEPEDLKDTLQRNL